MRKEGLSIFHRDHAILWSQLGLQTHFHVLKWETDVKLKLKILSPKAGFLEFLTLKLLRTSSSEKLHHGCLAVHTCCGFSFSMNGSWIGLHRFSLSLELVVFLNNSYLKLGSFDTSHCSVFSLLWGHWWRIILFRLFMLPFVARHSESPKVYVTFLLSQNSPQMENFWYSSAVVASYLLGQLKQEVQYCSFKNMAIHWMVLLWDRVLIGRECLPAVRVYCNCR